MYACTIDLKTNVASVGSMQSDAMQCHAVMYAAVHKLWITLGGRIWSSRALSLACFNASASAGVRLWKWVCAKFSSSSFTSLMLGRSSGSCGKSDSRCCKLAWHCLRHRCLLHTGLVELLCISTQGPHCAMSFGFLRGIVCPCWGGEGSCMHVLNTCQGQDSAGFATWLVLPLQHGQQLRA